MKNETLILTAPDFATIDTLARRPEPCALWPVGPQSLTAHWLDHAVRSGCKRVVIHAADRPALLRSALGGGTFWSLQLEVSSEPAPAGAVAMIGLPNESNVHVPKTPLELLQWWFYLNQRWLAGRDPAAIAIDRCRDETGWIGPGANIHPSASLVPPYWIGAGTVIGPECRVGPFTLVGANCLLEKDVHAGYSLILHDTFLGRHLDVRSRIVDGGTLFEFLVDGTRVEITDRFIASALERHVERVPWIERFVAAALWLPARLLALGAGRANCESARLPGGERLTLETRSHGPLLARRAGWLKHVIGGRMRLVGVLPRATKPDLPEESRRLIDETQPGAFALSDLHGVHTTRDPGETVHALYQAAVPDANARVRRNLFRLCSLCPPDFTP